MQVKRIQAAHLDALRIRRALIEQAKQEAAKLEQEAMLKRMTAEQLAESLTAFLASEYHINPRQAWHLDLERLQLVRRDDQPIQE